MTKHIIFFLKNNYFKVAFFSILLVYILFFIYAISKPVIFTHEDESIYLLSSKCFAYTNSIKATDFIDDKVSKIGECNWYGPFYQIVFGFFMKFTTTDSVFFIWFNAFCVLLIIVIIFKFFKISNPLKYTFATYILLYPTLLPFLFTTFPEVFNILLAVILAVFLYKIDNKQDNKKLLIAFVFTVIISILFRITFVFWLLALIPLGRNIKEFFLYLFIFVLAFIFTLLYKYYFNAPYFAEASLPIDNIIRGDLSVLGAVLKNFIKNAVLFFSSNKITGFIFLFLIFYNFYFFFTTKRKIFISILLVTCSYIVLFFSFYTIFEVHFNKQIATLFVLLLLGIIIYREHSVIKTFFLIGSLFFLFNILPVYQFIMDSHASYNKLHVELKDFSHSIQNIQNMIGEPENEVIIRVCYWDWPKIPLLQSIPVNTKNNKPIRYSWSLIPSENVSDSLRFCTPTGLKFNYLLSRYPVNIASFKLIEQNQQLFLYKEVD